MAHSLGKMVGLGFRQCVETVESARHYTAQEANSIPPEELTTNTVFKVYPSSMNTNVISRLTLDEHLAKGIPALSKATGATKTNKLNPSFENDLQEGLFKTNGWWRTDGDMKEKWLHSDIKDAAYYYVYPLFHKIVLEGDLK